MRDVGGPFSCGAVTVVRAVGAGDASGHLVDRCAAAAARRALCGCCLCGAVAAHSTGGPLGSPGPPLGVNAGAGLCARSFSALRGIDVASADGSSVVDRRRAAAAAAARYQWEHRCEPSCKAARRCEIFEVLVLIGAKRTSSSRSSRWYAERQGRLRAMRWQQQMQWLWLLGLLLQLQGCTAS